MIQTNTEKSKIMDIRRDRFTRIVERRVNHILDNLDNLGKCSNKQNYEYSPDDVKKTFKEIERKVKEVKTMFQGKANNKQRFKL